MTTELVPDTGRARRARPVVLASLLAITVLLLVACDATKANTDYTLVNKLRANSGVAPIARSAELDRKAAAHAARMAASGTLFHSDLAAGVSAGWKMLGENVAMGTTVEGAQQALEASAPHVANLLNAAFNQIGIGVKSANGYVYLVQVFASR